MLKNIGAVIVGYFTMAIVIMVVAIGAFVALGPDRAFVPNGYMPSTLWIVVTFACGLIAAIAGGWICAAIAGNGTAPTVLAGIVLVLGLIMVYPAFFPGEDLRPTARMSGEPWNVSLGYARQPAWVAAVNPILGALGTIIGARLRGPRS